jgi:hypothetical protein
MNVKSNTWRWRFKFMAVQKALTSAGLRLSCAARLQPVGAGGETEQQHAFRHAEFGRDCFVGGCFGHHCIQKSKIYLLCVAAIKFTLPCTIHAIVRELPDGTDTPIGSARAGRIAVPTFLTLTRLSSSNRLDYRACCDDDSASLGQGPSRASSFGWGSFAAQTARENGRTG